MQVGRFRMFDVDSGVVFWPLLGRGAEVPLANAA